MKDDNIIYQKDMSGYRYIYDKENFINVFDIDIKKEQSIYRIKAECKSQKEFEIEIIYVAQKVYELCFG